MLKLLKKYPIISFMFILFVIKLLIVSGLPIWAWGEAGHDDRLMINYSVSLLNGEWLGQYNERTLIKGIFFPFILVVSNFFNISYTTAISIIYAIGCVMFVIAIKDVINNNKILMFIYIVLLFCPVSYSLSAFQRVYRNSISPAQIILLIAFFSGMYLRREKNLIIYFFWTIGAGVSFVAMWNTREDGIWIIPFVSVVILITIIKFLYKYKIDKSKIWLIKIVVTFIPIIILIFSTIFISSMNYKYYGVYTNNELLDSNFTKAYKSILSIEPEEKIDYVSVPHTTVKKLYEVSPTFGELKPYLENSPWDALGEHGIDGNIEDGWFFWAMRESVFNACEKKDAVSINEFYLKIYNEVEQAFNNGQFERRKIFSSPLMTPWDNKYIKPLINTIAQSTKFVITYENVNAKVEISEGNQDSIRLFESITKNQALKPTISNLILSGWAFPTNDNDDMEILILNNAKEVIATLGVTKSEDVFEHFIETTGNKYYNAKKSRFYIKQDVSNIMPLYFQIKINGNLVEEVQLDSNTMRGGSKDYYYNFDTLIYDNVEDVNLKFMNRKIIIPNLLTELYSKSGFVLFGLGVCSYIFIVMKFLLSIKSKRYIFLNEFLVITGVIGSLFVLIGGVSYTDISAYDAINVAYLSAAYPLVVMFWSLSIGTVIKYIFIKE